MRIVTDVLSFGGAPVAFDEIELGKYQGVCPWCEKDLEIVEAKTFGELYGKLFDLTAAHMPTCEKRQATQMQVES